MPVGAPADPRTPALNLAYATGSLLNSPDAPIVAAINGNQWATAKISFSGGANTPSVTVAYSLDGGGTFLASGAGAPALKQINAGSYNITFIAGIPQNTGPVTWELPLAGNVTHVRVLAASSNTTPQIVTISGGTVYVPGVPVKAVLQENAQGAATNNTPTFDLSGWAHLYYLFTTTGAAPVASINAVDDAGALNPLVTSTTAATNYAGGLGPGLTIGFPTAGLVPITASVMPRRVQFNQTSAGVTTSRWRVEVDR